MECARLNAPSCHTIDPQTTIEQKESEHEENVIEPIWAGRA